MYQRNISNSGGSEITFGEYFEGLLLKYPFNGEIKLLFKLSDKPYYIQTWIMSKAASNY